MPTVLPNLTTSIFWRVLAVSVIPPLLLGVICGGVALRHSRDAAMDEHIRISTEIAERISRRLQSVESAVLQATLAADSLGRSERSAAVSSLAKSNPDLQAVAIVSPERILRDLEMRPDLASFRPNLAGLDLSKLIPSLHSSPSGNLAHGPTSPINSKPLLLVTRNLNGGEMLLGFVDIAAICGDGKLALFAGDCSVLLNASGPVDQFVPAIHAFSQKAVPARTPDGQHLLAVAPVRDGDLQVVCASDSPAAGLWSADLRIVLLVTGGMCLLSTILSITTAWRVSRPVSVLSSQLRDAVAHEQGTAIPPQTYVETEAVAHTARQLVIGCRDTQDRLATIQQAIQAAAAPLSRESVSSVCQELARALASVTGARCVLIAEWVDGSKPRAHVIVAHTNVPLPEDLSYELSGNPSQQVLNSPLVHVRSHVLGEYPESPLLRMLGAEGYACVPLRRGDGTVGGHLEIIDDHDIVLTDSLRDLLTLFSARAAGEVERLRAARRLSEAESLYRSLSLDQHEIVCRFTADSTLTFASSAFCQAVGRAREDLVGRSLLAVFSEDDREPFLKRLRALGAASPATEFELPIRAGDAKRKYRWTIRAMIDQKGRLLEYQGTAADVTDLRKLESALVESETRLSIVCDNAPIAFWVTDWTTQECLYASPGFQSVWGISPDALKESTMAWTSIVRQEDRAAVVRKYLLHAAEGQYEETYRITRPDGAGAVVQDRAVPIREPDGHVRRIANIAYVIQVDEKAGTSVPVAGAAS